MNAADYLKQRWRFFAFIANCAIFYSLFVWGTSGWNPTTAGEQGVWFLCAIAWWTISLLSAPFFRPPKDALGAALTAIATLIPMNTGTAHALTQELTVLRSVGLIYATLVALASVAAAFLQYQGRYERARRTAFSVADRLAKGEVILGIPALISIVGFSRDAPTALITGSAWFLFSALQPVEFLVGLVLRLISYASNTAQSPVGIVRRVDDPNIVRVELTKDADWIADHLYVARLPGGQCSYVLPLFTQIQENELVGTGFCAGIANVSNEYEKGEVYDCPQIDLLPDLMKKLIGGDEEADLVGFVVEGSKIGGIKFETARERGLEEGVVVFCNLATGRVFYQILDAETAEESFKQNPRGTHIAHAMQLGTHGAEEGFRKFPWLPPMNSPVFRMKGDLEGRSQVRADEFVVGQIPSTNIGLVVNLPELVEYHSAILGMTGTGKTELALDIIRTALKNQTKVFCVDLTGEYRKRLEDLKPKAMGLTRRETQDLDDLLFQVESLGYKAVEEKKALRAFISNVRARVTTHVASFLESEDEWLGLFELAEVTNTRATLRTTELFLSEIMLWARTHRKARRILIVLEEAHTIIPETAGAGFDADTQWVVGRIGQIALQGRKYGVGLMIVSQRTALVSKTILSQCNTYFTHSLVDHTSLSYLANIYSVDHVRAIPNLRFLEFIAFGKAVRSERPMLIRRKFDESKQIASNALNQAMGKSLAEDATAPETANSSSVSPIPSVDPV